MSNLFRVSEFFMGALWFSFGVMHFFHGQWDYAIIYCGLVYLLCYKSGG